MTEPLTVEAAPVAERPPGPASPWTPLRIAAFRMIWLATIASNVGTWMHDTAAGWLMTSLTPSTLVVALLQTASSLPVLFLALPAGALADLVDRRRLLIVTQSWMLAAAAALSVLTFAGAMTPARLLTLTFVLGVGSALNIPAWQATTADLVPREELAPAVALTGISTNIARAIGPAIGGLVVATLGPAAVFFINSLSFVAVVLALWRWSPAPKTNTMPAERVVGAIRAGARYVRHNPPLRAALQRTGSFIIGASALWALLPVLARRGLGLGAAGYGILLGSLGAGAIAGGVLLPRLRRQFATDQLVLAATALFAAACVVAAVVPVPSLVAIALAFAGAAWMTTMPIFNVSVQRAAADWARARSLAVYVIAFQGVMAIGAVLWGTIANRVGISNALLAAAATLIVLGSLGARARPLAPGETLDLSPSDHWRDPVVSHGIADNAGPVVVTVEYVVPLDQADEFARTMRAVAKLRRRDGAFAWGLYRDTSDPTRCVEIFMAESWGEHLRQHGRATIADAETERASRAFHVAGAPPRVTHLVSFGDR
jgi:predicted MFS family arabinose efflux permease